MKLIILLILIYTIKSQQNCTAWGIRLSLGQYYMDSSSQNYMNIAFNTDSPCFNSYLQLDGQNIVCDTETLAASSILFTTYVHLCSVNILQFTSDYKNSSYVVFGLYSNGSISTSPNFQFALPNKNIKSNYQILLIGDWGLLNSTAAQIYSDIVPILQQYISNNQYAFTIFLGDIAYDFCNQTSLDCNNYKPMMQAIQFLTSVIPFMPTTGEHQFGTQRPNSESLFSGTFVVPNNRNLSSYFFEVGNTHYQTFNAYQEIIKNDVSDTQSKVDTLKNFYSQRGSNIDWVIPFSHYSIYCAGYSYDNNCQTKQTENNMKLFTEYFYENKIDVYLSAHLHLYDRTKPVNKLGKVALYSDKSTTNQAIYLNPQSPIYIIEGSASNSQYVETNAGTNYFYEAVRIPNTGFSVLSILQTDGTIQNQHISGKDGTISETFIIQKTNKPWIGYIILSASVVCFIISIATLYFLIKRKRKIHHNSMLAPENLILAEEFKNEHD